MNREEVAQSIAYAAGMDNWVQVTPASTDLWVKSLTNDYLESPAPTADEVRHSILEWYARPPENGERRQPITPAWIRRNVLDRRRTEHATTQAKQAAIEAKRPPEPYVPLRRRDPEAWDRMVREAQEQAARPPLTGENP